jgi:transcriptional regulator with XRE-family HTH domain
MNLILNYITDKKMTVTKFAQLVDVPVPTIWRYVHGKSNPSPHIAMLIEKGTKGKIKAMKLLYPK